MLPYSYTRMNYLREERPHKLGATQPTRTQNHPATSSSLLLMAPFGGKATCAEAEEMVRQHLKRDPTTASVIVIRTEESLVVS
jgi:hypothetical protein